MTTRLRRGCNPNPISKIIAVILLGTTVVRSLPDVCAWGVLSVISLFLFLNGQKRTAFRQLLLYAVLFGLPGLFALYRAPFVVKMLLSLLMVIRLFFLPFAAGKFLIRTSDVGSILSSMDALRIPASVSSPIAVIFRFFPAFREERRNIRTAMRIRGVLQGAPWRYPEYVAVPLLIASSEIADDIAMAAEAKCIANPVAKTRYTKVAIGAADLLYLLPIVLFTVGGWLW